MRIESYGTAAALALPKLRCQARIPFNDAKMG